MKTNETSPFKGKTGWGRIMNAARYSVDGLKAAWAFEAAFRQVCLLAVLGIGLMPWLAMPATARALIVFAHLFSVVVELINSAIEAAVDHTSLHEHPLAKRAKDLGSAAQLISLLNIAAVWLLTLLA
jgi:diacylglycerol kinase (ATP)